MIYPKQTFQRSERSLSQKRLHLSNKTRVKRIPKITRFVHDCICKNKRHRSLHLTAAFPSSFDASTFLTAGSGVLVAWMTTVFLNNWKNESVSEGKAEINQENEKQKEIQEELKRLQTELELNKTRIQTLEKARASAVSDIMTALSQKRDTEFALEDAKKEIDALKATKSGSEASMCSSPVFFNVPAGNECGRQCSLFEF